jgi:phytol kinase
LSPSPWLRILLVSGLIGALIVVLRAWQRKVSSHPELVRKLAHIGTGLVALSLPFLFQSAWPVLLLSGLSIAAMSALRLVAPLKEQFGNVLYGVARSSGGEIYFPLSVAILFVLAKENALLFIIPILILTFADAVAALAGGRYGVTHYDAPDGEKSIEGSVAFFLVAFLSTHIPLLLLTDTGRAKTLLIGLTIGLVAMLLEAIAWRGLDNLFIPLGGFILLKAYLDLDTNALIARFCVTLALVILLYIFRRHATLDSAALLGAALIGYVTWALGGWKWLVPPMVFFISYPLLSRRTKRNTARVHDIHAVLSVTSAGLLWLCLSKVLHNPAFYFPFTVAFAAHLAIVGTTRIRCDHPALSVPVVVRRCILVGWLILFLPYYVLEGLAQRAAVQGIAALIAVTIATLAFNHVQPRMEDCPTDEPRWLRQAGIVFACSVLALLVNFAS